MKRVLATLVASAAAFVHVSASAEGSGIAATDSAAQAGAVGRGAQTMDGRSTWSDVVDGEVRWVDLALGKLTVMHGPHKGSGMLPMTMVVRVSDSMQLRQLKAGDKIQFTAERVNGLLTATMLRTAK